MITIQPNGNIKLYSGIRLDNAYQNALSFENAAARTAFFHNDNPYLIATLTKQSYQRVTSGQCDIEMGVTALYNCNYMAFQNLGFSNRWFYAFVTNVEYINNITTRVFYEIDVLTTFYFDWNYLPSFVEREHTATDAIGENLVPESINYGECAAFAREWGYRFDNWSVIVALSAFGREGTADEGIAASAIAGDYVSGVSIVEYEDITTFKNSFLNVISGETREDVVCVFMFPNPLVTITNDPNVANGTLIVNRSQTMHATRPATLDGYTPKNKKMFTYPFSYLCVDTGSVTNNYRYEWFDHDAGINDYSFTIRGACVPGGGIYAAPVNYKNSGAYAGGTGIDHYIPVFDERIEAPKLPQVCYPIDSFKAWLAQSESTRQNKILHSVAAGAIGSAGTGAMIGAAGGAIGMIGGAVAGGLIGAVGGAIGGKISDDMSKSEAADMKNKTAGNLSGTLEVVDNKYGFIFKYMSLCAQDAKIVDDYFSMFGYAIHAIKTPQIRTRPHWNYIKTIGLNMAAQNVPADYVRKIKEIHNAGVTYWKVHDEIGNYNLNNQV